MGAHLALLKRANDFRMITWYERNVELTRARGEILTLTCNQSLGQLGTCDSTTLAEHCRISKVAIDINSTDIVSANVTEDIRNCAIAEAIRHFAYMYDPTETNRQSVPWTKGGLRTLLMLLASHLTGIERFQRHMSRTERMPISYDPLPPCWVKQKSIPLGPSRS